MDLASVADVMCGPTVVISGQSVYGRGGARYLKLAVQTRGIRSTNTDKPRYRGCGERSPPAAEALSLVQASHFHTNLHAFKYTFLFERNVYGLSLATPSLVTPIKTHGICTNPTSAVRHG